MHFNHKKAILKIIIAFAFFYGLQIVPTYAQESNRSSIEQKLSFTLKTFSLKEKKKTQQFIIVGNNTQTLLAALEKEILPIKLLQVNEPSHAIVINTSFETIQDKILPLKEVIFVDAYLTPHSETSILGYDRSFHGINAIDNSISGANGKNRVVGVKEQTMDAADIDLYKRVLPSPLSTPNTTGHATVIASIIGGAGNSFYDGRGIANECLFFPSSFDNLFADDATVLTNNKVMVQNHSYGTVIQPYYGAEAVSYDVLAWNNKNFVPVFSAGNQGTAASPAGVYANLPGFANLTGNFKMAKNVITVGAVNTKGIVAAESSAGPIYDGRIAPQLVALGPNGTSDAAAVVSGTVAVLQQVYADSNNNNTPAASLVKAILYNTADDIYTKGIDHKTGYGLLNSYASVKAIQQKLYDGATLSQGQSWIKNIIVPSGAASLKVTLAWTDSAAAINNNKALLNDLDIEVQELNTGIIYKPWCLNTAANADSLTKAPIRKRDSLNTAEQVSIELPAAGNYQIKVMGTNIVNALVPFNIAYSVDTLNTFQFTSPQHASDIDLQGTQEAYVRWRTFVADTNQTGKLYISYNSGSNWELLNSGQKIYTNNYLWKVKDTASRALLKMETSFGNFYSKEFVIAPLTRLQVDFLCTDSFRLSWNKLIYADAYKIYSFTDSAYLKPLFTVADTFAVLNRVLYPSNVYAIEPLLNNGLPAARSQAIDISAQGVHCFYNTFYYNVENENKIRLILELSAPSYVDSIRFERVTATGQLLKGYENIKVSAPLALYDQLMPDVVEGTSYWRAKLIMKNGAVLYTYIVPIITSGNKYVLFYPNPVKRNNQLQYMINGLAFGGRLQFFDLTGRLLNTSPVPGNINISMWPTGLVIYKLFSADNKVLETGKIAVQ